MTSSINTRSFLAAVIAALLAASFVLVPAPKAEAWSHGACTTTNGVTVIVDYAGLGGGTVVRCAQGAQSSGIAALRNAGFTVGFVQKNMSQGLFVCRINGKPLPSEETCANTPPANASWSYWLADRGGSWRYSNAGAGNRKPPAGTVEGWRFNNGRPAAPSVAPPAPIPPKPTHKPTHKPTTKPTTKPTRKPTAKPSETTRPTSGASGSGSDSNASGANQSKAASSGQGKTANPNASPTTANENQADSGSAAVARGEAASLADQSGESSSPAGTLVALAGLALLGVVGGIVWVRRSRGR